MARPTNADSGATRLRILTAASQAFADEGATVSIRRIAAASGVTLATVHHYFGSKDQLHAAAIDHMYGELASLQAELMGGPLEVEHVVRNGFRFAWRHRGALRLLMRTIIDRGHMEEERRATVHLPFIAEAARALAAVLDRTDGELRLVIQTVMHLVVRYALTSSEELALLVGGGPTEAQALAAVEDHLVGVAAALLSRR
jgi:AcrR family transcriptional regulator